MWLTHCLNDPRLFVYTLSRQSVHVIEPTKCSKTNYPLALPLSHSHVQVIRKLKWKQQQHTHFKLSVFLPAKYEMIRWMQRHNFRCSISCTWDSVLFLYYGVYCCGCCWGYRWNYHVCLYDSIEIEHQKPTSNVGGLLLTHLLEKKENSLLHIKYFTHIRTHSHSLYGLVNSSISPFAIINIIINNI